MSETHVDLNTVVQFNSKIEKFSQAIKQSFDNTNKAMDSLSRQWRDDQFQTFKSNLKKHSDKLKPLSDELTKYEKHIKDYWIPAIKKVQDQYRK
jgi:uncharacterized protein YukE